MHNVMSNIFIHTNPQLLTNIRSAISEGLGGRRALPGTEGIKLTSSFIFLETLLDFVSSEDSNKLSLMTVRLAALCEAKG